MRFTKIPLIATLMAVALSLLIVLPGLAQTSGYDDTRGTLSSSDSLKVDVLNNVATDDTTTTNIDERLAESYFNGNLYVSNAGTYNDDDVRTGGAYNQVRVRAVGADRVNNATGVDPDNDPDNNNNVADPSQGCATATVKNNRNGRSIKVAVPDFDEGGTVDTNEVTFEVIPAGRESRAGTCIQSDPTTTTLTDLAGLDVTGRISARHGDTLTITVAGVTGSVTIKVDGEGPEFSEISPSHNMHLGSQTVKIRFAVTDGDSGLAHDGELDYTEGDSDARAFNWDDDNFTTGEPRAVEGGNGTSRDINVMFSGDEKSSAGTSGWGQRGSRPGVSYDLDMAITSVTEGSHDWYLSATDRAGNKTQTDSDSDESGPQPFVLIVDVSNPEFRSARTGISYDLDKGREIADSSSIAVIFEERDGSFDSVMNVDVDKFLVDGVAVTGFVQPASKVVCKNTPPKKTDYPVDVDNTCGFDRNPLSRVYLQLAEPLAPDAKPLVSMFGGAVNDLAGNPSNQDEVTAQDFIAPTLSVSMSTPVTGRPVVRHNGEVSVTITSDEELRRLPTVYFIPLVASTDDNGDLVKDSDGNQVVVLGASRAAERVSAGTEDNSWSQTYRTNHIGSSDDIYAVVVVGEDDNDNVGSTPGYERARADKSPMPGNDADVADLMAEGLLVEIDTNEDTDAPAFTLTPETGTDTKTTESNSPFITVDFSTDGDRQGEDKEYGQAFKGDSHSAVEIASITLNGNSVADRVSSVSNNKYTVGLQDLSNGSYELKVTGRDDVGNETTASYKFTKAPREPYELSLTPGWNLVSLPGTPLDSSVQAVMSDSMEASIVLAYQDDTWLTAVNDSGTWRGTLTDIVGGYGYWVQTTAFESISTLIPETDTSSVLPTAKVIKGWNLLGVVDVQQAEAGDPPSGGSDPDDYFDNIDWKVAYSFNTSNNQWNKLIPTTGANDGIENGKGYWVWSIKAGTLVP